MAKKDNEIYVNKSTSAVCNNRGIYYEVEFTRGYHAGETVNVSKQKVNTENRKRICRVALRQARSN